MNQITETGGLSVRSKLQSLLDQCDLQTVELTWAIFSAAAFSYKADSLLRPFPHKYIKQNGEKDINTLRDDVKSMPYLTHARHDNRLTETHCELLLWLLESRKTFLQSVDLGELETLQKLTKENIHLPKPQRLYELKHNDQSDSAFSQRRGDRNILHAYHGSKLENFYSIIHHGLHAHMNKTSLYGEGTYLCMEPSVALGFSPWGTTGWSQCQLAESLSIVALCEVIDDPSVKHTSERASDNTRSRAPNSVGGDVPDKYIVVTNDEMVRVKYLFVYANKTSQDKKRGVRTGNEPSAVVRWLQEHRHIAPILFYISLLMLVALFSSKRVWIRIQHMYEETIDIIRWSDPG